MSDEIKTYNTEACSGADVSHLVKDSSPVLPETITVTVARDARGVPVSIICPYAAIVTGVISYRIACTAAQEAVYARGGNLKNRVDCKFSEKYFPR